jgi:hypothetical protein
MTSSIGNDGAGRDGLATGGGVGVGSGSGDFGAASVVSALFDAGGRSGLGTLVQPGVVTGGVNA